MEPSGPNLDQAGQYNFRLLFEECCKQEVEKEAGGGRGRGEGVETLAHQNIMLQRTTEPENARSTSYFITDWSFRLSSDLMRPAVF